MVAPNPLSLGHIETGHTVLDLGCGAGLDAILAARHVGPTGTVMGIDMTTEMLDKAKRNAVSAEVNNIEFHLGEAEELPVVDETGANIEVGHCLPRFTTAE